MGVDREQVTKLENLIISSWISEVWIWGRKKENELIKLELSSLELMVTLRVKPKEAAVCWVKKKYSDSSSDCVFNASIDLLSKYRGIIKVDIKPTTNKEINISTNVKPFE